MWDMSSLVSSHANGAREFQLMRSMDLDRDVTLAGPVKIHAGARMRAFIRAYCGEGCPKYMFDGGGACVFAFGRRKLVRALVEGVVVQISPSLDSHLWITNNPELT